MNPLLGTHIIWVLTLLLIILNIIITVIKAYKGFVFKFQKFYFKSFALHFSWWQFFYFSEIHILLFYFLRNVVEYFISANFFHDVESCRDLWSWNNFLLNHFRQFFSNTCMSFLSSVDSLYFRNTALRLVDVSLILWQEKRVQRSLTAILRQWENFMCMQGELNRGFSCILLLCETSTKMVHRRLTIFTTCGSFFRSHGSGEIVLEGRIPSLFRGRYWILHEEFPRVNIVPWESSVNI